MNYFAKLLCCISFFGTSLIAHAWPTQPINLIVPFSPGGLGDQISRIIAKDLAQKTNTQVIVSNIPGAEGLVAMRNQLNKPNDGHSFIFVTDSLVAGPWFIDNDTTRQFDLITIFAKQPLVVVGPKNQTIADLHTKSDVTIGVVGLESPHSYWLRGLDTKIKFVQVPYKGANPAIIDVMGGHIDYAVVSLAFANQFIDKLSIVMLSNDQTSALYPNIPTFRQAGFSGPGAVHWYGFITRSGMDVNHTAKFNRMVQDIINSSAEIEKLRNQGLEFIDTDFKQTQQILVQEIKRFSSLRSISLK